MGRSIFHTSAAQLHWGCNENVCSRKNKTFYSFLCFRLAIIFIFGQNCEFCFLWLLYQLGEEMCQRILMAGHSISASVSSVQNVIQMFSNI